MKYHEQHEAFKLLSIQQGIGTLEQVKQAMPFGHQLPPHLLERWLNKMLTIPNGFSSQRRYVNRFKLGADPEFLFAHHGERINADALKLSQGLAFGMDNNGRLTEIRPYPHRSALHVTASILTTLRWLSILYPQTMQYEWLAGAFLLGDGLGGHVHFGRKRPGRAIEIKALDVIDDQLMALEAYPVAEVVRRRQGDQHHQFYGLPGDYRKQRHGYEYRTFPSWLDSPALAFLTLTLGKLAVHNPILTQGYMPLKGHGGYLQRVRNLLAYYQDTDDDARLALALITRQGLPFHMGGDFKRRWGLGSILAENPAITFIPSAIEPDSEDVAELFDYFNGVKALQIRAPKPTWTPLNPPDQYVLTIKTVKTLGAKGLGELTWDVVQPKSFNFPLVNLKDTGADVDSPLFYISPKLAKMLPRNWRRFCSKQVQVHTYGDNGIYSSETGRTVRFDECRRVLLETVFPYWQITKVKSDSYQQWQSTLNKKNPKTYSGTLIYGSDILPYADLA